MLECVTPGCASTSPGCLFLEQAAKSLGFSSSHDTVMSYFANQRIPYLYLRMVQDQTPFILQKCMETLQKRQ